VPARRRRGDRHHRRALRGLPAVAVRVSLRRGELPQRRRGDPHLDAGRAPARHLGPALRSGFVAVAGRPNVGKSTLVNALTGEKVAIVSRVPHTARHRIRGVWTGDDAQLVLVGLPGWHEPIDPSASRMRDGVDEVPADLVSLLPESPLYYPAGEIPDMPLEARIAQLVREQALRLTKEEVPHALTAELVEIDDRRVHVRLYTETESQKQILIGNGGQMVREIRRSDRPGTLQLLGHSLFVQRLL